jgi:hypothetical protein
MRDLAFSLSLILATLAAFWILAVLVMLGYWPAILGSATGAATYVLADELHEWKVSR